MDKDSNVVLCPPEFINSELAKYSGLEKALASRALDQLVVRIIQEVKDGVNLAMGKLEELPMEGLGQNVAGMALKRHIIQVRFDAEKADAIQTAFKKVAEGQ